MWLFGDVGSCVCRGAACSSPGIGMLRLSLPVPVRLAVGMQIVIQMEKWSAKQK